MIWEDDCYLLSKSKFRENANIINIFTKKKGKVNGIVYAWFDKDENPSDPDGQRFE